MRRREFIALIGGAVAWPSAARSQQAGHIPRIGVLWPGASPPASPRMEAFRQGLRDSGLVEGRDVEIELRYAQGGLEHLPELAAELVRLKVDVIQASGDLAPRAAQRATGTIPIVAFSDDILGAGLVTSLSRPGGTTTGLTILSPELSAKRLEVLRDVIPELSRVASLWDPTTGASQVALTESAAQSLQIRLKVLELRRRGDLADAFLTAKQTVPRPSTCSPLRSSPPCTEKSSIWRPNTVSRQSTNGRNMRKPGASSRTDPALWHYGGRLR